MALWRSAMTTTNRHRRTQRSSFKLHLNNKWRHFLWRHLYYVLLFCRLLDDESKLAFCSNELCLCSDNHSSYSFVSTIQLICFCHLRCPHTFISFPSSDFMLQFFCLSFTFTFFSLSFCSNDDFNTCSRDYNIIITIKHKCAFALVFPSRHIIIIIFR